MNETLTGAIIALQTIDEGSCTLGEFADVWAAINTLFQADPKGSYLWRLEFYVRRNAAYLELCYTPFADGRVVNYRRWIYYGVGEDVERHRRDEDLRRPNKARRSRRGAGAPAPEKAPEAPVSAAQDAPESHPVVAPVIDVTQLDLTPPSMANLGKGNDNDETP